MRDGPLLGRNAKGALAAKREPAVGELYRYHLNRLDWMDGLARGNGLRRVLTAADLKAAHAAGEPAVIFDTEGLDFLEGKLDRIEESYHRGVRVAQLVHYTPNEIGDFQTGDVTHKGLTSFGAQVIGECHRLGLVVDIAHGTEEMVDIVGVDHVCAGTDQQAAAGALEDYGNFSRVVDLLLQKGLTAAEAGKLAGENFVRSFAKSTAAQSLSS